MRRHQDASLTPSAAPVQSDSPQFGTGPRLRTLLVRGSLASVGVKLTYAAIRFVTGVLLARILGPGGLGVYSFALAVAALLAVPAQFGFPGLLLRLVAVYHNQSQLGLVRGLVNRALFVVAVTSFIVSASWIVMLTVTGSAPGDMPVRSLIISAGLIPGIALLAVHRGALCGMGHVVRGLVPENLVLPTLFLIFLVVASWVSALSVDVALSMHIASAVGALIVGWWLWLRVAPKVSISQEVPTLDRWRLREALPFLLLAGSQVLNYRADILMLGLLTDQGQVGVYRVALQIAEALGLVLVAVSTVIGPHLARLHAERDWFAIQKILVTAHRSGLAVLLTAAFGLWFFGQPLLGLIFGQDYVLAFTPLLILAFGKAAYATVGFAGLALSMFGLASVATAVTLLTAVVNIGLNWILIPPFGTAGAAVASACSALAVNSGCVLWMFRRYRVNLSAVGNPSERQRAE